MKRIIAIALALTLVLALAAAPAFAVEPPSPVIFLAGFGTELYLNDGTPEEKGVLLGALNTGGLLGAFRAALLDAVLWPLTVLCSPNRAADALSAFVMHWLGNLACDENGDSIYPVSNTSRNENGRTGTYACRPFYQFHFDWRLDPMETARALHSYIQKVKLETGSARVNIHAISFGGAICCAYLEQYGTEDLESLFLCVSAHGGLTLGEDLIQKKLAVSGKGLAVFLAQRRSDHTGLSAPALRALELTGLPRLVEWLLNAALRHIRDRFYEQAVIPLLAQMPAAWAFAAADEAYENGKRLLLADTVKYAGLIEKIDSYHYSVGNRTNEILRDAAAEIKVALVCGYDYAPVPLGGTFLYQSDFLIDTARESGGAVCADYGKALPGDYKQAVADGHNHVSGDRAIDASACALPEQTWFVKGYQHQYEYNGAGIYAWFLSYAGQPTVWSAAAYPQFM